MNHDEQKIAAELFDQIKTAMNKSQAILNYKNFMAAVVSRIGLELSLSGPLATE